MANDYISIETDGGASVGNNVQTGRDFVGRDLVTNILVINWIEVGKEFTSKLEKDRQLEKLKQKVLTDELKKVQEKLQGERKELEVKLEEQKTLKEVYENLFREYKELEEKLAEHEESKTESVNRQKAKGKQSKRRKAGKPISQSGATFPTDEEQQRLKLAVVEHNIAESEGKIVESQQKLVKLEQSIAGALQKIVESEQKIVESEQITGKSEHILANLNRFDWSKAEQDYLNKVRKLNDRVRILGSSEDISLGDIFTHVHILNKLTANQRYNIDELRRKNRPDFQIQDGKRTKGIDLVKTKQNLFILGKPGAGKTTFLKYITIQAAQKELPHIPIFISLNQWAESQWGQGNKADLLPFIVEQFAICDFPDAEIFIDFLLKSGHALILFDGLDEVKQEQEQRRHLTLLLQNFASKYDKSQHLITCRIAASDYIFSNFTDVEIANFADDQVREYALKWFGKDRKKFEVFMFELNKPNNKGLAELCNTPLLLSLLCLTFDNDMRFPPNRAELYEDALETLLRKWDSKREIKRDEIYRGLSYKRKLQLLMSIAVPTFERGEIFFRQRDLEKWIIEYLALLPDAPPTYDIDGTVVLKSIEAQHGILVERAQGIYSFSHLTFQEYLTARYVIENHGRGVVDKLISRHLTDKRWREVFLLAASLLNDANDFLRVMSAETDRLVSDSPNLICLLKWAHSQTMSANATTINRYVVSLAYISLSYVLNRALKFALIRDLEQDLEQTISSALAQNLSHEQELVIEQGQPIDDARDIVREFDPSLSEMLLHALAFAGADETINDIAYTSTSIHTFASLTTPIVALDFGLYYLWAFANFVASEKLSHEVKDWQQTIKQLKELLKGTIILTKQAGLAPLAQDLESLTLPLPSSSKLSWQQYAYSLLTILRHKRGFANEWSFNKKEINILSNYFYANELLIQCLKIAVVPNRQGILNELLRPPKSQQIEEKEG